MIIALTDGDDGIEPCKPPRIRVKLGSTDQIEILLNSLLGYFQKIDNRDVEDKN